MTKYTKHKIRDAFMLGSIVGGIVVMIMCVVFATAEGL